MLKNTPYIILSTISLLRIKVIRNICCRSRTHPSPGDSSSIINMTQDKTAQMSEKRAFTAGIISDVLERSFSIQDSIDVLQKGTILYKVRDKGVRGVKVYQRKCKLDLENLCVLYYPNKRRINSCFKIEGSPHYDLTKVTEIRIGHGTDTFNTLVKIARSKQSGAGLPRAFNKNLPAHCCFSMIMDDNESVDFIADDENTRNIWADTLSHMISTLHSLGEQKKYELFLREKFRNADKNNSNCLSFKEVRDLIEDLNVKMDKGELKSLFEEANGTQGKPDASLSESEFVSFYYSLLKKPELEKIYRKYAKTNSKISVDDLTRFFMNEQNTEMLKIECEQIIEAYEPSKNKKYMSNEGFIQFMMFSELQNITATNFIYQDMTQPLSHYWIASSHNTYLTGNQVTGESSVDAYIKALKEGCRCVELDCWDGDENEPIIYHGWTLTSKILFKDVINDAIKPYAFDRSDYPLILSIENHCSLEMQDKMADYMTTILGDMLYTLPPDEKKDNLPSPEALKHKILIKAKRLPPGKTQDDVVEDDEDEEDDERDEKKKKSTKKISKKLSDLVNYIHAVHFPGFPNSDKNVVYFHMSSFGESKTKKFLEDPHSAQKFVKYNAKQISRVYPSGKRQDSSNLKVMYPWNAGCQIVALNYQTEDKQNFYNRAKFRDNGGCGYVLKPSFLRRPDPDYSPSSPSNLITKPWNMTIRILSGQHIPKPKGKIEGEVIDPYVKVRIRGHPDDHSSVNKAKTEPVSNNGFNPVWNTAFHFSIKVPSLAFLEFKVKDHSKSGPDKDVASFICPVKNIKEGYRQVHLEDYSGKILSPSALFIHIKIDKA
ncbi:1-phosphatidylinositol 4,5-bisphosphate phosphodiesterase delta-1 isoform X4 [Lepeophtheirus salmonis]|uniref:Phosphoinositide phospholipase C n=1 Tax=Lepeophtheirus salmonis TaxID=72036 RepID=A0A0K2UAY0_LEPSM|nr:1-phosphatidylinositol 4,5-bisphosphate phosphodiesterase delta-1-like isoform X2 [Lepeophtheirus salmonis]